MRGRAYLRDAYLAALDARVVEARDGWLTLDETIFFPGGGGQPPDRGRLVVAGEPLPVAEVREDEDGRIWHRVDRAAAPGTAARAELDWPYRHALMRHHGLLHVVNTVARQAFGGAITGVQIGPDRSRIDFRLAGGFSREQVPELERRVGEVLARDLAIGAASVSEAELRARPELVRTLDVRPPVVDGRVRVVEIAGFDAQACGGTHVRSTGEIGRARVVKFDNKGRENKRFYWTLES